MVTSGATMFASGGFCDTPRYLKSAEADGTTWQAMTIPKIVRDLRSWKVQARFDHLHFKRAIVSF